jgi:hypothetical protein
MPGSRRKGEASALQNERDFPHAVELPLPSGGFRAADDAMAAFHRERGIQMRQGRGRYDEGQWYVTFCFADLALADDFQRLFGGQRLRWPVDSRTRRLFLELVTARSMTVAEAAGRYDRSKRTIRLWCEEAGLVNTPDVAAALSVTRTIPIVFVNLQIR